MPRHQTKVDQNLSAAQAKLGRADSKLEHAMQNVGAAQAKVWATAGSTRPVLLALMILLGLPLAIYIYILYAQVLSILMIQKALKEKGLSKKTESNLKKVYASNVMILIIEGTSTLILGILFTFLLIAFFMYTKP